MIVHSVRSGRRQARRRPGFTLMEVMIAAAILVILAGVGGIIIFRQLDEAKISAAQVGTKELEKACELYKARHGDWPEALQVLAMPEGSLPAVLEERALIDPWQRPYGYEPGTLNPNTHKPLIYSGGPNPGDPNSRISNW
jgi:general secretion pathway protein G